MKAMDGPVSVLISNFQDISALSKLSRPSPSTTNIIIHTGPPASSPASSPLPVQTATMCFYDMYKFSCRDWKWGNFRQHCQKEYRTGETCGTKLIYQTIDQPDKCTFCEKIEKKLRRRQKAAEDRQRWMQEPQRFRASIEKATEDITNLTREIQQLQMDKDAKYHNVGNTKRRG
ncbi:hypothetical protein AC579_1807 [Pseudocercospora musae]|uniref:Uncharacterized protein n=1 Tax=Pseudocercospora musae TaxID=113226 RepID=A0A139IDD7_9PEZI|nr:hypothetical protein AC579_1807 [Pseudocercospora musae]